MRGGKRAGAGRPPMVDDRPMRRVTAWLTPDIADWVEEEGRGNVSKGIRRLLEELDQRRGAESLGESYAGFIKPDDDNELHVTTFPRNLKLTAGQGGRLRPRGAARRGLDARAGGKP